MIPILGLARTSGPQMVFYLFLTVIFLVLSFVVVRLVEELGCRLILLGLLTAVAAVGFGAFLPDTAPISAGTLMKIAFLLALGGIGICLSGILPSSTRADTKKRKGSKDAD